MAMEDHWMLQRILLEAGGTLLRHVDASAVVDNLREMKTLSREQEQYILSLHSDAAQARELLTFLQGKDQQHIRNFFTALRTSNPWTLYTIQKQMAEKYTACGLPIGNVR
jgi:hypothetical protein